MPKLLLFYNCGTALADIYDKTIKIQYIFSVLVIWSLLSMTIILLSQENYMGYTSSLCNFFIGFKK